MEKQENTRTRKISDLGKACTPIRGALRQAVVVQW